MKTISAVFLAFTMMPAVSSAAPQMVEIAPFTGQRFGGSFVDANTSTEFKVADANAYGLVIDFDTEPDKQIEVYLSHQNTRLTTSGIYTGSPLFDLAIDYYHIGGLYMFPTDGLPAAFRPFVSGTFGLTRMTPAPSDLNSETRFSISLGAGAKYYFGKTLGARLDVRGIYTAIDGNTAVFCSGGCTIKVNSSGFIQTEVSAGLIVRF
jgi:hypothetical protein